MRIRLGDADRERLGCPEWLDHEPWRLTQLEAETLQDVWGVNPNDYHRWRFGTLGQPEGAEPSPPAKALRFHVWQALRRSGCTVALTDLDFDLLEVELERDPEPEPGKDPSTPKRTSTGSASRTRSRSSASSASSPRKPSSSTSTSSKR